MRFEMLEAELAEGGHFGDCGWVSVFGWVERVSCHCGGRVFCHYGEIVGGHGSRWSVSHVLMSLHVQMVFWCTWSWDV